MIDFSVTFLLFVLFLLLFPFIWFTIALVENGAAPVAFAGGILETLIGVDLLHLPTIEKMSVGVLSIEGASVFDGIALCGLLPCYSLKSINY